MSNDSYDGQVTGMQPEDHDDGPEVLEELKRRSGFERRADIPPPVWAPDDQHPDYAHLLVAEKLGVVSPRSFSLTPEVLDLLIAANSFQPKGPKDTFVFAIRGGELAAGPMFEDVTKVELNDVRPDHRDFHCTIGYYHRASRKLTAYRASTVPNVHYMTNYYKMANKIGTWSDIKANLLPTGLYRYRVGTHRGKVTPALQLADYDRPSEHGDVTVLRTTNVMSYRCDGFWDRCLPGDNVHCAYKDTEFSSAGCQTIQGGDGWGLYGKFQTVLKAMGQGTPVDYVLFTGKEAAIAATLIAKGQAQQADLVDACLRRLRGGSEGSAVTALQTSLGIAKPTGFFGAVTRKTMVEREAKLGRADVKTDSIFSPTDEAAFGWTVFKAPPAPTTATTAGVTTPVLPTPTVAGGTGGTTTPQAPPLGSAAFRPETLILVAGPPNCRISADSKTLVVPGEGTWTVGPKIGLLNFTPEPAFSGRTQPVRYEIHDIYDRAATAVASVTVAAANRPPLLSEDVGRTFAGQQVSVSVLMNDAAVDGAIDPATLQLAETAGGTLTADRRTLSVPNQGVWTVAKNGTIDFAPYASFIGVARATYQVATTLGGIATSTVTVTVDPAVGPLQLGDDTADTSHGQAVTIDVLKNDTFGQAASAPVPTMPSGAGTTTVPPVVTTQPGTAPVTPASTSVGAALPPGTVRLKADDISKLAPKALEKYARTFATSGDQILAQYGINANAARLTHFLGQLAHEFGVLRDRPRKSELLGRRTAQVFWAVLRKPRRGSGFRAQSREDRQSRLRRPARQYVAGRWLQVSRSWPDPDHRPRQLSHHRQVDRGRSRRQSRPGDRERRNGAADRGGVLEHARQDQWALDERARRRRKDRTDHLAHQWRNQSPRRTPRALREGVGHLGLGTRPALGARHRRTGTRRYRRSRPQAGGVAGACRLRSGQDRRRVRWSDRARRHAVPERPEAQCRRAGGSGPVEGAGNRAAACGRPCSRPRRSEARRAAVAGRATAIPLRSTRGRADLSPIGSSAIARFCGW